MQCIPGRMQWHRFRKRARAHLRAYKLTPTDVRVSTLRDVDRSDDNYVMNNIIPRLLLFSHPLRVVHT